jgi:protein-S-isoprenylcysteine O-methyltransferase Ste14
MAEVPSLGARGGGWVFVQFALMAAVGIAALVGPAWPDAVGWPLAVAGAVLALAGGALAVVAARALGRALTPFPRPNHGARIVEQGPYRVVRHPMYAAGGLFLAGLSLAFSPAALALTAVLLVVWGLKARVEERFLLETLPDYGDYMERTRYRLVPHVY